ncbi:hypothetical protein [Actinoplanes sp. NPDC051851]|uniref:copper amine oxidase n=1 Tax=Actinoplanes sp. NPDC051851 TaxID=3154753 RepID=UPI00343A694F
MRTEADAQRTADNLRARTWLVGNPDRQNRLGQDVAYALCPEGRPTLLADPGSVIARRGAFATRHLWVTPYDPEQRWAAGEIVNQSPGGAGLPAFTAGRAGRPVRRTAGAATPGVAAGQAPPHREWPPVRRRPPAASRCRGGR